MIFLPTQPKESKKKYIQLLEAVCSLSRLFSDSKVPYLYYRAAENIFCDAFETKNLARTDGAFDSHFNDSGIGLKTFVSEKGNKFEKISEFNKLSSILSKLQGLDLALKLAEFRNERIESANRRYKTTKALYHCVARKAQALEIFETPYNLVNVARIKNVVETDAGITFEDGIEKYSFNRSKSTLFKQFQTPINALKVKIRILEDPYEILLDLFSNKTKELKTLSQDFVILPLYSETKAKGKFVPESAQLNHWNADESKRPRKKGEIYIKVPAEIHDKFPDFFPEESENKSEMEFYLQIPTGVTYRASLCQGTRGRRKALMTKDNDVLEHWLLRDLLKLGKGELLTYERLAILGFDSVKITKIGERRYSIDVSDSSYGETNDEDLDG